MRNQSRSAALTDDREPIAEGLLRVGKDEMNLAEFPISLLTNHVPNDQTMVEFKDRYFDDVTGKIITRCVTITAAPEPVKHFDKVIGRSGKPEWVENPEKLRFRSGLPRAVDDDVLLGLIQLTKQINGFTSPEVQFSRMALIRLLGWPDSGVSFRRLDESLQRWVSVTLKYENAWRDNRGKRWLSDSFHILDNVQLNDSRTSNASGDLFPSVFRWNVRVFDSFQAGYLKSIDYQLYKSLKYQTSKRMYRYLSKRMYHKIDVDLSLVDFAIGHVGLSSSYAANAGKLKEKLKDGLDELEAVGFLEAAGKEERYRKDGKIWNIWLKRRDATLTLDSPAPIATPPVIEPAREVPPLPIVAELVSRGVSGKAAADLAERYPHEMLAAKIESFDWEMTQPKPPKKPAGYLVKSITDDYALPKGFVSKAERETREAAKRAKEDRDAASRRADQAAAAREQEEQRQINAYWDSLSAEQQQKLQAEADALADPSTLAFEREHQMDLGKRLRRRDHIRQLLRDRQPEQA